MSLLLSRLRFVLVASLSICSAELTLQPRRNAFIRGEKFYIHLSSPRQASVSLVDDSGKHGLLIATLLPGEKRSVWVDTLDLRPGRYSVTGLDKSVSFIVTLPPRGLFRIGLIGSRDQILSAGPGADFAVFPHRENLYEDVLSRAMLSVPIIEVSRAVSVRSNPELSERLKSLGRTPEQWETLVCQVISPSLSPLHRDDEPYPCPRSKVAMDESVKWVEKSLSGLDHPAIEYVAFDIDYGLKFLPGKGLSCFCPWCRGFFSVLTGIEQPPLQPRRPGIIRNDPLLRWIKELGFPGEFPSRSLELFNTRLRRASTFPAVQLPGGYSAELDAIVMRSNCGSSAGIWVDFARALSRGAKPVWLIFPHAESQKLRRAGLIAGFRGADRIIFSGSLPERLDEIRLAGELSKRLTPPPPKLGLLLSRTSDAFQKLTLLKAGTPASAVSKHLVASSLAYQSLLRTGLSFCVVTEDFVPASVEALLLAGVDYISEETTRRISHLGLYRDRSSLVGLPAKAIDFDFSLPPASEPVIRGAQALLRSLPLKPDVFSSEIHLSARSGDATYILALPEKEMAELILPKARFAYAGSFLGLLRRITIRAENAPFVALTTTKILRLEASASYEASRIKIRAELIGECGRAVNFAFPVELEIRDALGDLTPYSRRLIAEKGKLNHSVLLGMNDPKGVWHICLSVPIFGFQKDLTLKVGVPRAKKRLFHFR